MGLKDAVLAERKRQGGTCTLALIYQQLTKKDAAELREIFALPSIDVNNAMIQRALGSMGYKLSNSTIQRHRAGECACGSL
jgi:Ca2+-binding EF-hand superfamily protein